MDDLDELIGESPALEAVKEQIRRLAARQHGARRPPSILIHGETGTGKGLVARLIHRVGPRTDGPFVDVNCAAIPEPLLEAELFGFERGAFTDARRAKPGLFQTAHRGTIFLDEVGLLPEPLQAKLLKVIEEQVLRRLGGTSAEPVDAWVISATNADLQGAIRDRRFREDLFHRLAVLTLRLPPLRERGRDILLLAQRFLARACADYGLDEKAFTPEADARLLAYAWPGNIRELFNVVERVALLGETSFVTGEMLALPEHSIAETAPVAPSTASLQSAMREHLLATLEQTRWNISQAAALLGITRNTLRARIKRLKLSPQAQRASPRPPAEPAAPRVASRPAPAPPVTAPASAIRWENRRVALVRAALMRPDADVGLSDTSRGLKMLVDKVKSFGGRIEEMSPHAIGAVFGLEPAEDAARRAAHAAMAIRKAGERAHRADGERFAVKIAIHVGHVLVGQAGPSADIDSDAKRAQWNVLDALLAGAAAGDVLVSASAAPFLEQRFQLARPEPVFGEPVFALVGNGRPQLGHEDGVASFVGRRHELELLRTRFESARAGQIQIVGIGGDPGIGTSRLLAEFRRSLRGGSFTYLESRCSSGGAVIPYLPVRQILRQACRLNDTEPPERSRDKLRATLERLGIETENTAPFLMHVLGVKGDGDDLAAISPDAIQARAFEILRRMWAAASRRGPLVIVIEECQRMDTASAALVTVLESIAAVPLLLILTHPSEYRPPWRGASHVTHVHLPPLSPPESRELLDQLLPEGRVSAAVAAGIIGRAGGNPLFLEELARASLEPEPAPAATATLGDVLLAKIRRLSERARQVVEAAAVLGLEAARRVLAEICPDSGPLDEPLRELIEHGLVREITRGDELVYVFEHTLVQETAYASLTEERRRALHVTAGATLERLYQGRTHEVVEWLAHHFGAGDRPEEAVDWALLAAEKAQRGWANAEALAQFEAALARLDRMPDTDANRLRRIDAVVRQAEVRFALGLHAEHIHALESIRRIVEACADPWRRAAWHYWTGFLHSLTGSRPEVAMAYCREASAVADAAGFDELGALAECCLADVHDVAGRLGEAIAAGERALAVFETRGSVWWVCRALWVLSTASLHVGSWEQALAYCRRALDHARSADDPRLRAVGWWRLATVHIERGDPTTGLRHCEEALSTSSTPLDAAMVQMAHGYGLIRMGDLTAGTAELAQALAWFDRAQQGGSRTLTALRLGEGYLLQGERGRARALLEEVIATCRRLGYGHFEAVAERLLGECLLADDDRSGAATHLETAASMLGAMGARNELAKALVANAEVSRLEGDRAGARERLESALEIFEALGTLEEPARVRVRLASLTLLPSPTS